MHVLINLNKPKGLTSNDALIRVKKTLKIRKAGHCGTLDPLATGVLLIGTNEATKILPYLSQLDKEYFFTAKLGIMTDTYDSEGKIIQERDITHVDKEKVLDVLSRFEGKILQKPPVFSALKHRGKPLYEYARKGISIIAKEREVNIHNLELIHFDPPKVVLRVLCSTGTYIRSLCHDIGVALGTGAHIIELKRTRVGNFTIQESIDIDELLQITKGILNIDDALNHMYSIMVDIALKERIKRGEGFVLKEFGQDYVQGGHVRLKDDSGKTFAIGCLHGDRVKVKRILHV